MPVEITAHDDDLEVSGDAEIEESLFNEDGSLTLEAETIGRFLNSIDYDPLFEDAEVAEFVTVENVVLKPISESDGRLVPCADDDEAGLWEADVETLDGETAAAFVDEEDLAAMFRHYIANEYPRETLEDRMVLNRFSDLLEAAPFKKGDFRRGVMKGVSGKSKGGAKSVHNQRVRMMVAMLKKGAIQRVAKGGGYKGGDYVKGAMYGGGTESGKRAYKLHSSGNKQKKRRAQIKSLVDNPVGRKKVVRTIFTNLGKKMPAKWIPPEDRGHGGGGGGKSKKIIGLKKGAAKAAAKKALKNLKKSGKALESQGYGPVSGHGTWQGAPLHEASAVGLTAAVVGRIRTQNARQGQSVNPLTEGR